MRAGLLIAFVLAAVAVLAAQFPGALHDTDSVMRLVYLSIIVILLGGSLFASRTMPTRRLMGEAGIWLMILLAIMTAYAYRKELAGSRLAGELAPTRGVEKGVGEVTYRRAQDGHFYIDAVVNGIPVRFMVDTGASDIALSRQDAERLGFALNSLNYDRLYSTANGVISGARVTLEYVAAGPIRIDRVPASVGKGESNQSLLGMTFLDRLHGYRVESDTLTLVE